MSNLKALGISIAKIILGVVLLLGGLVALDILVYISATGSTFSEKVASAYTDGYDKGYAQNYEVAYQEAHSEAYEKGYDKGLEIGLRVGSRERVATRVELRKPTYKELREFLAQDKTDSNPFIRGEYVCFDFAAELNNNAEANGNRAAYVRIHSKEWGHAVVAFETVDRGLIFVEPQSDKDVELVIGQPYPWQASGADRPTKYDDPVDRIQIIW